MPNIAIPTPLPICPYCGIGNNYHLYDCIILKEKRSGSTPSR